MNNHSNPPKSSQQNYQSFLEEYAALSQKVILSEAESARLGHILEVAINDHTLGLLLNEIDEAIFQQQNDDIHTLQQRYQNEFARVLELTDGNIPSHRTAFEHAKLNLTTYVPILDEYQRLIKMPILSETEADRMGQILEIAYDDELLTLLIETITDSHTNEVSEQLEPGTANNVIPFPAKRTLSNKNKQQSNQPSLKTGTSKREKVSIRRRIYSGVVAGSFLLGAGVAGGQFSTNPDALEPLRIGEITSHFLKTPAHNSLIPVQTSDDTEAVVSNTTETPVHSHTNPVQIDSVQTVVNSPSAVQTSDDTEAVVSNTAETSGYRRPSGNRLPTGMSDVSGARR